MKLTDVLERKKRLDAERAAALAEGNGTKTSKAEKLSPVVTVGEQVVEPGVAIMANADDVTRAMGTHPQLIYLDQIDLDSEQPRKMEAVVTAEMIAGFDPDAEDEAPDPDGVRSLARSIYIHGLLAPLVVDRSRGRFKLVAGERRYWAVRLLQWKQVPAVIWGMMSPVHRLALQVTENLQRQDLSREGKKAVFLRLSDELDSNVSEVCRLLGISRTTFYRTVGKEEGAKKEKRMSSGQLVKVLVHMKERLPNMEREDREKVLVAVTELQGWIKANLDAD